MSLFGRDLISTQDWSLEDIQRVLLTATEMKLDRYSHRWNKLLENKNFLMMFYSPSVRTHLSFVSAATELGGHAQYMEPSMGRFKSKTNAGETIEDVAKVVSCYMAGIGIRIMEGAVSSYREGNNFIREYANFASIPVINMADDVGHPCQAMADVMGWAETLSGGIQNIDFDILKRKTLLVTWAKGVLARSWNSPQASLLLASRMGMNIRIARPDGYDLDHIIYDKIRENCSQNDTTFEIIDNPINGYKGAHIVYSRHWISQRAYEKNYFQKQREIEEALSYGDWITTVDKMKRTENAIFTHPMPVDRGNEVEDEVAGGKNSVIYTVADNRLHVQKSVLAHTMSEKLS